MNPYLIVSVLGLCTLLFAAVVWAVVLLFDVPLLLGVMLVYLGTVVWMQGMQRRARGPYEAPERRRGAAARTGLDTPLDTGSAIDQRPGAGNLLHQS